MPNTSKDTDQTLGQRQGDLFLQHAETGPRKGGTRQGGRRAPDRPADQAPADRDGECPVPKT